MHIREDYDKQVLKTKTKINSVQLRIKMSNKTF